MQYIRPLQVKPDGGVTRTVSFNVLTLRYAENSGFGYAGDIDGGYAVVGAYSDTRYETDFTGAGVAYFFERGSDGVWPLDAVHVVDQTPYRSFHATNFYIRLIKQDFWGWGLSVWTLLSLKSAVPRFPPW